MNQKILLIALIHIIGAIVTIIIHLKDGTVEYTTKHGDGVRIVTPSDVIIQDLLIWEVNLLVCVLFSIDNLINDFFCRKYY